MESKWFELVPTGQNSVIRDVFHEIIFFANFSAVVLAIYLTNGVPCLGRFPINFKSEVPTRIGGQQKYFYHVVLGLALGESVDNDVTDILKLCENY